MTTGPKPRITGPFQPPRRESGLARHPGTSLSASSTPDWQLERPVRLLSGAGTPLDVEVGNKGELRAARVLGRRRTVLAVAGPERLGGQWWSEAPFQRDYYRVHFDGLGAAWVYRSAPDGGFWLHGLFD
jgi:protein ImuB